MNFMHQKVGRLTVAIGLVAVGLALLYDNLTLNQEAAALVVKLWPLLLIGFGVEYLLRSLLQPREGEEARLRFDFGGAFLLVLVVLLSMGVSAVRGFVVPEAGRFTFLGRAVEFRESAVAQVGESQELRVSFPMGSVRLEPNTSSSEVRVEATYFTQGLFANREGARQQLEQIELKVTEGRIMEVAAEIPSRLNDLSLQYVIYAPPGMKVKVETLGLVESRHYTGEQELISRAGRVSAIAGRGPLGISAGAGSITVRDWEGPVAARTHVGSITLENLSGSIQAESGTGSINVAEYHGGRLAAETRTGSLNVRTLTALQGDVSLKTQTGSITLRLPLQSSMRATAQTRTGSLHVPSFMATTRNGASNSAVGTLGDGTHTVNLETGTGSITFTAP